VCVWEGVCRYIGGKGHGSVPVLGRKGARPEDEEEVLRRTLTFLECEEVCCSVLQCVAVCCSVLQCAAVRCSVLYCVAVCCSVLQCGVVCCSVL